MSEHLGLLGFITEANEIREELGVSVDEAFRIQRERSDARLAALEPEPTNVIQFRPRCADGMA
jgi:hypothetical protein